MTSNYYGDVYKVRPSLPRPNRVLAIGAHFDDVEFGSGATLSKWSKAGTKIEILVMTDGSKGTWDENQDGHALALIRKEEQLASAKVIGNDVAVKWLNWIDGELVHSQRTIAQVAAEIRGFKPDVVVSHDPWKRYRLHPDHRNCGQIAIDAVVAARDPHFYKELGPHHRPNSILLFEPDQINYVEEVDEVDIEVKVSALLSHRSQHQTSMEDRSGSNDLFGMTRAFARRIGQEFGCSLGEPFHLIDDV
ncbi:MAG: PIG-L family deacetylase [Actinomycetota bacterium]|nr:PIG-L family deacetylase [Actinomycetota bacterium]